MLPQLNVTLYCYCSGKSKMGALVPPSQPRSPHDKGLVTARCSLFLSSAGALISAYHVSIPSYLLYFPLPSFSLLLFISFWASPRWYALTVPETSRVRLGKHVLSLLVVSNCKPLKLVLVACLPLGAWALCLYMVPFRPKSCTWCSAQEALLSPFLHLPCFSWL